MINAYALSIVWMTYTYSMLHNHVEIMSMPISAFLAVMKNTLSCFEDGKAMLLMLSCRQAIVTSNSIF